MAPLTRGVAAIDSGSALNQEAPTDVSQSVLIAASSATVTLLVIAIVLAGGVFFCLLARRRSGSSTRFTNAWRVPRIASRQTPQPSTGQSLCDALIHSFFRGASRMKDPNDNSIVAASSAIVTVDPSAETNGAGGEVEMESAPTSAVVVKEDDLKESVRI